MKDLLPFVERELSLLGAYFQRLAEQYPGVVGDLKLQSDIGSGDPDIRRFTQAAAVHNARTAKKLDDDYPELTARPSAPQVALPSFCYQLITM